ncbi:MAG: hypothetical protein DRQ02_06570 [Candidatus Latescibacterota bacterium]|nr:MAG: hypothetical protein DRQ02_06570 [Candidatus Latescibacterota bacterium]
MKFNPDYPEDHKEHDILTFDEPAYQWIDGLPIGSGKLGAMVMGYPVREVLALNHDGIWRANRKRTTKPVCQHLPELRRLCWDGKWKEAENFLLKVFQPEGGGINTYQPACDLIFDKIPAPHPAEEYVRQLDMSTGVVSVRFKMGEVEYLRRYFASAVHDVIVMHVKASHPAAVSGQLVLWRQPTDECKLESEVEGKDLVLRARFDEGVGFSVRARVIPTGGKLSDPSAAYDTRIIHDNPSPTANRLIHDPSPTYDSLAGVHLCVEDADELLVLVAIATDQETDHPSELSARKLDQAGQHFQTLLDAHICNRRRLYDRVSFHLGGSDADDPATTPEIVKTAHRRHPHSRLWELMFNLGRYLLISSSRPGSNPANLQGVWNGDLDPPWQSDFHLDLNLQMNYWLAEPTNLLECILPLFDLAECRSARPPCPRWI